MTVIPKRLIEVDLPIKAISAHARREKSIRHGHISTLHIWWARRPLAACRAVLCAALWPDPADEACPQPFRDVAALVLCDFAERVRTDRALAELCADHWTRWNRTTPAGLRPADPACWPDLRYALLDFISDFANWDASTVPAFLDAARLLTHTAHAILDLGLKIGDFGPISPDVLSSQIENLKSTIINLPRPLVADPFAGGGAIPLEALRVGADAFASDLNPVAVLLNKVVLEYIPKYASEALRVASEEGETLTLHGLAEAVRYWGQWIKARAEAELAAYYPPDPDGATPIAYLWGRTVMCEGPGCGAEVPLMRSLWLAKKRGRGVALQVHPDLQAKRVDFEIIEQRNGGWYSQADPKLVVSGANPSKITNPKFDGTVRRGAATCPVCGYTTPVESVRRQLKARRGGADDARLFCVVTTHPGKQGRFYRLPTPADLDAVEKAKAELERRKAAHTGPLSLVPDEEISLNEIRRISVPIYGMTSWGDMFSSRQALALTILGRLVREAGVELQAVADPDFAVAIQTCLALAVDKQADLGNALCPWEPVAECPRHLLARQAIGMVWDFAEGVAPGISSGSWAVQVERMEYILNAIGADWSQGQIKQVSATAHPLPDNFVNALITDPPYYDAVPYAYLSDFFYVWLKRSLGSVHPDLFGEVAVPKDAEIVVDRPHELSHSTKDIAFYERELTKAFAEGRRVLHPGGVGVIVFASKTTASWEAILQAVVDAGWTITGSWPIDTEMAARVAAQGQARLASSIHLIVRPRCRPSDFGHRTSDSQIGDWRDVLQELPARIHAWMPRLAEEGVVGADAIFACLGPALEIFSRYDRVERASGEQLTLSEYLEYVWAAVANEALALVFAGGDVTGFEADARLTAMWLWTLTTEVQNTKSEVQSPKSKILDMREETEDEDETQDTGLRTSDTGLLTLEYDAARKIAQGLGAHLEQLEHLVEIKGGVARLLPVAERARRLFGDESGLPSPQRSKPPSAQLNFGDVLDIAADALDAEVWSEKETTPSLGDTVLDRLHQAMLLFGAGRSDALKRFLVEDGVGQDARFWRLAQALSALYPSGTEEKRWVDGVLARKKGLGF